MRVTVVGLAAIRQLAFTPGLISGSTKQLVKLEKQKIIIVKKSLTNSLLKNLKDNMLTGSTTVVCDRINKLNNEILVR